MAPLPPERVTAGSPPFTCVGVDYMGPILVKRARSQVKRFGCIFTCLATRAIHIEIAHALDTNAFLNAFSRFVARRGGVLRMISDNGSNLVGGERELQEGIRRWNQAHIHKELSQRGIQWHFNPPGASHYGGVFERMVQSIKRIMARLVGNKVLDDDALHTYALEVERIVNSRPIAPLSDDPNDGACLTPSMLLNIKLDACVAPDVFAKSDGYKKSWRVVQRLADMFWAKWLKCYIPMLQTRQKWHDRAPNLNPGDIVLIADENCVRGLWPKAVVIETFPDQFGVVRKVRVRTGANTYIRDVRKLCLLEAAAH